MKLPNYEEAKIRDKNKTFETKVYETSNIKLKKKYYLETYGCQMNERDSEIISGLIEEMGFQRVYKLEEGDLVIINSCSIRENAHLKVFGLIGMLKHLKESKPDLIIALGGCMAQEEGVVKEIKEKYPFVNIVFGTHNIYELPHLINETLKEKQVIEVLPEDKYLMEYYPSKRESKYQAFVNIIYGCNKFCTYCIVPFTRGSEKSREEKYILEEVDSLIKDGYQEITLLGQNVNAYGKDRGTSLAELLEKIALKKVPRITFMTSHPWDFTDSLIEVMKKNKNILRHLHLPVQSGSDKILKKMGRRYTAQEYLELVKKIKEKIPDITLTTDIIVGFPGEDEEDFLKTLELVRKVKFSGAYTFIYSKRENTVASKMKDQVNEDIQKERLKRLNKLINYYALKDNKKWVGKKDSALILGPSKKKGKAMGYTSHQKVINVEGTKQEDYGKIIDILVTDAKSWSLDGRKDY